MQYACNALHIGNARGGGGSGGSYYQNAGCKHVWIPSPYQFHFYLYAVQGGKKPISGCNSFANLSMKS